MINKLAVFGGAIAVAVSLGAQAKVSEDEAAKLGTELTPVGAVKEGNKDGTIPAWDPWPKKGKISGEDLIAENFPDTIGKILEEKPKFTITKDNMGEYADKLTDGHKALFNLYPDSLLSHKLVPVIPGEDPESSETL